MQEKSKDYVVNYLYSPNSCLKHETANCQTLDLCRAVVADTFDWQTQCEAIHMKATKQFFSCGADNLFAFFKIFLFKCLDFFKVKTLQVTCHWFEAGKSKKSNNLGIDSLNDKMKQV